MTHWLLDLTWGGRVFRFASADVEVLDADGVSLPYVGGLVPRYEIGAPIGEVQADIEVDLGDLVFPVDVALWHRQGRPLDGSTAQLSTWTEGDTWEERRVRLSGRVTATQYGAEGEPVAVVLRWASDDGARIISDTEEVNLDTWNTADEAVYGTAYVKPFGTPGLGLDTSVAENLRATGGTRLTVVDTTPGSRADYKLLLATGAVGPTSITLIKVSGDNVCTFEASNPVTVETDGLSRTVSTVVPGVMTVDDGASYFCDWSALSGSSAARDSDAPILSFGQFIYWLVTESGADYDVDEWRGAVSMFAGYRVGYYVDDVSVSPTDVLKNVVLPLLPLSVVPGPKGYRPVFWRPDAVVNDARWSLVEGENVERASPVSRDLESVRNAVRLAYAPRMDNGEPYRVALVDETNNAACAASRTMYDPNRLEIETQAVYDAATAERMAHGLASMWALPVETVTYDILDDALDLSVGDVVALTDDGLHLSSRVAHVARVAYDGAGVSVDLVMFGLPGRDYLEE